MLEDQKSSNAQLAGHQPEKVQPGATVPKGRPSQTKGGKLPDNQERFCREYIVDRKKMLAAVRAGYSPRSAAVSAAKLLKTPKIRARIDELLAIQAKKIEMKADDVLQALAKSATYDVRDFFDEKGTAKDIKDLDDLSAHAVAGFEFVNLYEDAADGSGKHCFGQLRKFKLTDRLRALEMLGKHLALFPTKVEVSGPNGGPILIAEQLAVIRQRLSTMPKQETPEENNVRALTAGN